jgi:hypothetical protein
MMKRLLWPMLFLAVFIPVISVAQTEEAPKSALTADAQLCTGVQERMPVGMADSFAPEVGQVYLWCKISGNSGETTIKHVWLYQGKEMATVDLTVKNSGWRTWSAKKILPEWTGDWTVKILDSNGAVIKELAFKIAAK